MNLPRLSISPRTGAMGYVTNIAFETEFVSVNRFVIGDTEQAQGRIITEKLCLKHQRPGRATPDFTSKTRNGGGK